MALPYWIEHDENNLPRGKIWVKLPSLEPGEFAIVEVRKAAGYAPSPNEVFDFFDDFYSDSNIWHFAATYTISNSKLTVQKGSVYMNNPLPFRFQDGYIVEVLVSMTTPGNYGGTVPAISSKQYTTGNNGNATACILYMREVGSTNLHWWAADGSGTGYTIGYGYVASTINNTWYKTAISVTEGAFTLWLNDQPQVTKSGFSWHQELRYLVLGTFNAVNPSYDCQDTTYEWILVRKYTDTPPSVTLLSSDDTKAVFRVVNTSSETLTDYQIALDAPFDVAVDESLEVVLGNAELNYDGWIEHNQDGNPGRYFWVRIPQLPAGETSFYVVRVKNKPTLRNTQSVGRWVFPIFDDFEGDLSDWYTGGNGATQSISNGRLYLSCSGGTVSSWVGHKSSPPYDSYIIETIWYWNSDGVYARNCGIGLCNPFDAGGSYGSPSYTATHQSEYDYTWRLARTTPTSYSLVASVPANSFVQKWWRVRFYVASQGSSVLYRGEMESDTESASVEATLSPVNYNSPFLFVGHYGANLTEAWFEWVFLRHYVEPFPVVSAVKELETDTEVYYKITVSNAGSDITDIQIPIPLDRLGYTSFSDELYITDSLPHESATNQPNLTDATLTAIAGEIVQDNTYLFVQAFRFTKELQLAGDLSTYARLAGWLRTELSEYVSGLKFTSDESTAEGNYTTNVQVGGTLEHTLNRFVSHLKFVADQAKEQNDYSGWIYLLGTLKHDYIVWVRELQFTPEILEAKPDLPGTPSSSKAPQYPSIQTDVASILAQIALKGTASFTDRYSLGGAQFAVSFTDRYDIRLLTDPVYHKTFDGFTSHSEDEALISSEAFSSYTEVSTSASSSDETPLYHAAVFQLAKEITASLENAAAEDVEFYGVLHTSATVIESFKNAPLAETAATQNTATASPAKDAGCVQIVEGVLLLSKNTTSMLAEVEGTAANSPKWQFALVQASAETKGNLLLTFAAANLSQNATWVPFSITYPKGELTITANLGSSPATVALNAAALVRLAQHIFAGEVLGMSRQSHNTTGLRAKVLTRDKWHSSATKPLSLDTEHTYNSERQTEYTFEVVVYDLATAAKVIPTPCAQPVRMTLETPYDVWAAIRRTIKTLVVDFAIEPLTVSKFLAYDASLLSVLARALWTSYTKDTNNRSKALSLHTTTTARTSVAKYLYLDTSRNESVPYATGIVVDGEMEFAIPPESTGIELTGDITKMNWYWTSIVLNMTRQCAQPSFGFKTASHAAKKRYPKIRVVLKDDSGKILWSYTLRFAFMGVYRDRIPSYTEYTLKDPQKKRLVGAKTLLFSFTQKPSHFVVRRGLKVFPVIYPVEIQPPEQEG